MRWVYLVLLVVIVAMIVVFVAQNRGSETLVFFNQSITAPLYAFFVVVYLLGMWTGGTVVGFVKQAYRQATEHEQKPAPQAH
jgi:lipopolysaccharide assembly protein A